MKALIELLKNKRSSPMMYILIVVIFFVIYLLLPKKGSPDLTRPSSVPYNVTDSREESSNFFPSREEEQGPTVVASRETSGDGSPNSFNLLANVGIFEDETPPDRAVAIRSVEKLLPHLPIYIENFETSIGLKTTINIYVMPGDRRDTVRLEIYNINFHNKEVREEYNPQVTAYKESFQEARKQIESHGVSMDDLNFIFGSREIEIFTTQYWIKTHKLL